MFLVETTKGNFINSMTTVDVWLIRAGGSTDILWVSPNFKLKRAFFLKFWEHDKLVEFYNRSECPLLGSKEFVDADLMTAIGWNGLGRGIEVKGFHYAIGLLKKTDFSKLPTKVREDILNSLVYMFVFEGVSKLFVRDRDNRHCVIKDIEKWLKI